MAQPSMGSGGEPLERLCPNGCEQIYRFAFVVEQYRTKMLSCKWMGNNSNNHLVRQIHEILTADIIRILSIHYSLFKAFFIEMVVHKSPQKALKSWPLNTAPLIA